MTHYCYGTGPRPSDADTILVFEEPTPAMFPDGPNAPGPETRIAWVASDPVLSRIKTFDFHADLWTSATPAQVACCVYEEAEKLLDKGDLARIEDRRARLQARKQQIVRQLEEQGQEAAKLPTPTGRLVGFELGKLLEPDAIILIDGQGNGALVHA